MNKIEFRKKQRKTLTAFAQTAQKKEEDQEILEQLLSCSLIRESQTIGVTASLPLEVDTSKIIARLWDAGKDVYLAKAYEDAQHRQDFLHYTYRSELTKSRFGVEEVADSQAKVNNNLDLLLVPGLAFSLADHARLGFGGGYYDRFLAEHWTSKTIALANSKMIFTKAQWPVVKTDIPVQIIITPKRIYR